MPLIMQTVFSARGVVEGVMGVPWEGKKERRLSKRAVQMALERLVRRQLVAADRGSPTAGNSFEVKRPWVRARR